MPLTALEIANAALVKLGVPTIKSFDEETTEASVALSLYEITRDALLATHEWSFAVDATRLGSFDVPEACSHNYGYRLPPSFIKALSTAGAKAYQISGRNLYSDHYPIVLEYIRRADECEFPSYFVSALVNRLAAEFCLPLTENASRAELLFNLAEAELKLAKLIDSQQDEPVRDGDFSMIEAPAP